MNEYTDSQSYKRFVAAMKEYIGLCPQEQQPYLMHLFLAFKEAAACNKPDIVQMLCTCLSAITTGDTGRLLDFLQVYMRGGFVIPEREVVEIRRAMSERPPREKLH